MTTGLAEVRLTGTRRTLWTWRRGTLWTWKSANLVAWKLAKLNLVDSMIGPGEGELTPDDLLLELRPADQKVDRRMAGLLWE